VAVLVVQVEPAGIEQPKVEPWLNGVLKSILDSKDRIVQKLENGTMNIFDKSTRRGVNISRDGNFNGFRELKIPNE
jgi:hypothetical protein